MFILSMVQPKAISRMVSGVLVLESKVKVSLARMETMEEPSKKAIMMEHEPQCIDLVSKVGVVYKGDADKI